MTSINENYLKLKGSYLFSEIDKRVLEFQRQNPEQKLIRLGIGDVTRPVPPAITKAMHDAVDEMARPESFKGYGPYQGYDFLRNAIVETDYHKRNINIEADEIFVSDGAKSDTGNIGDIFSADNTVAIGDPVYPVYLDTNIMAGRAGDLMENGKYSKIIYMPCTEENGFMPQIPRERADIIYLCFPNNPTGVTASREYLTKWVRYANQNNSVILYDSAYEAFIQDDSPKSIYEIDGAQNCAIEFRSFSKTAGFTGTRCAYTVVPKKLELNGISLNALWLRRQSTKFNGAPYVVQRGAFAVYSGEGQKQIKESIDYYMRNAGMIRDGLTEAGLTVFGGENAPYIWFKTMGNMGSWDFFDFLLRTARVVTTPGVGFGSCGEGFMRVTAFGNAEDTVEAIGRIVSAIQRRGKA